MEINSYCSFSKAESANKHTIEITLTLNDAKKLIDGRSQPKMVQEIVDGVEYEMKQDYNVSVKE